MGQYKHHALLHKFVERPFYVDFTESPFAKICNGGIDTKAGGRTREAVGAEPETGAIFTTIWHNACYKLERSITI